VAIAPPLFTKMVVVELTRILVEKKVGKEGVGGWTTTHFGWPTKPCHPLSPNFLHPPQVECGVCEFYHENPNMEVEGSFHRLN
jgi:hypothetical protein